VTIPVPARLLRVKVVSVSPLASWPDDGTPYANRTYRWTVVLEVTAQTHSSPSTRQPYGYNGRDIMLGDWMSNAAGGLAWKIVTINTANETQVSCAMEDVNQYNTYSDSSSNGDGSPSLASGFVFTLNSNSLPILTPMTASVLITTWATDVLSRFLSYSTGGGQPVGNLPTLTVSDAIVGDSPMLAVSPTTLSFDGVPVNTDSAQQPVHLHNIGDQDLNITSITVSGPFSQVSDCTNGLAVDAACTIFVTFHPTMSGLLSFGTLTINSNSPLSPNTVALTGSTA